MIEHDVINDVASDAQKEMHRLKLEEKKFQDSLADHYRTEVTRQVAEQRNAVYKYIYYIYILEKSTNR